MYLKLARMLRLLEYEKGCQILGPVAVVLGLIWAIYMGSSYNKMIGIGAAAADKH